MAIRIDPHSLDRAKERGASEEEILDVLAQPNPVPTRGNRFRKSRVFAFDAEWNGVVYQQKKVDVVYVHEGNDIVTVTVIVSFGKWEG